ncbi:MAG: DUF1599 domain-containing protein [Bacteroidota bacterium]
MTNTLKQFDDIIGRCRQVFLEKNKDYGTSWRILRPSSLTDQLYIKAKRIRSIEEKGIQKVDDPLEGEYMGLINYAIMALIQMDIAEDAVLEMPAEEVALLYDQEVRETKNLLSAKNHDYGEVWREMRLSSIVDLILAKLLRIKRIEDNLGQTLISEGTDANYRDIINYAIFSLILLQEKEAKTE